MTCPGVTLGPAATGAGSTKGLAVTAARGTAELAEEDVEDDEAEVLRLMLRLEGTAPLPMRKVPLGPAGGREAGGGGGGTAVRREGCRAVVVVEEEEDEDVVAVRRGLAGEPRQLGGAERGCGLECAVEVTCRGRGFEVERFLLLPAPSRGASSRRTAFLASFARSACSRFSLARWPALSKSAGRCCTVARC